jgi:hypothetical protein
VLAKEAREERARRVLECDAANDARGGHGKPGLRDGERSASALHNRPVRFLNAACVCIASTVVVSGCYWHGWPFDNKRMCPGGPAYPIDEDECERQMRPPTLDDGGAAAAASSHIARADRRHLIVAPSPCAARRRVENGARRVPPLHVTGPNVQPGWKLQFPG